MPEGDEKNDQLWLISVDLTEDGVTLKKFVNGLLVIYDDYQNREVDARPDGISGFGEHFLKL